MDDWIIITRFFGVLVTIGWVALVFMLYNERMRRRQIQQELLKRIMRDLERADENLSLKEELLSLKEELERRRGNEERMKEDLERLIYWHPNEGEE